MTLPAGPKTGLPPVHDVITLGTVGQSESTLQAVLVETPGAGATQFDRLPDLRLLSSQGTGLERIDLAAAAQRGIAVAYTPDVMTEDVADAAIGLMYAAARRVAEADRFVRAGRWMRERMGLSTSLHRKTAGIAGMGKIGQAIASRVGGLDSGVLFIPAARPNTGCNPASKADFPG